MWLYIISTFALCSTVYSLNILGIISLPLRSHYMAFKPLFEELAARGHFVTVIGNFPNKIEQRNFKDIDLSNPITTEEQKTFDLRIYEEMNSNIVQSFNFYRHCVLSPQIVKNDCENLFSNQKVRDMSNDTKYDIIFVEQFMSDCGLVFAGINHDAPIIGITSHVLLPWTYSRLGLPFHYGSDAYYFSMSGANSSLLRKIEAFVMNLYFNTVVKWLIQRSLYQVLDEYKTGKNIDVELVAKNRMKMVFSYQYFPLTGSRVLAPQLLEIGGLHVKKPKPLSQELLDFISSAENGVIYVSFGSMLKAASMSREKMEVFISAFKKIPQKVLWKWENGTLPEANDKIFTSDWFPQLDVLCHPKVVGFISHGGLLGTTESASCGVPMITVPFFGDQFANAASVRSAGLGTTIMFRDITKSNLVEAIMEITSEKMQLKVKEIANLWHDRPTPVMDSAIFWTEYVARHPDSPPDLPSKHMSLIEDFLLDIYAAIIAILFLVFTVIYLIFKLVKYFILNTVICSKKNKTD